MDISMEIPQKTKNRLPLPSIAINAQRSMSLHAIKPPAPTLIADYSQSPSYGTNLGAHQPMSGWGKCDIYINIYINAMEFYSATKKEILLFAGKWMELENIMLSEVSQDQKDKGHMFSLICRI
jgi:hypothetical protein